MTFADLAKRAGKLAIDNSPAILTAVGVVGAVTTAYLSAKATYAVAVEITVHETNVNRTLTTKERFEFIRERGLWKDFIPAVGVGCTTVACIIAAQQVGSRRAAGMAALYTLAEKNFDAYKAKVVEKIGEKKDEMIRAEVAHDRIEETYLGNVKFTGLAEGQPCLDMFSNQYFRSSVEGIRSVVNDFNHLLNMEGQACLGDFYRMLDIEAPVYAENIGWNSDRLVEVNIDSTLVHDIAFIAFSFKNDPLPDYGRPFRRY